MLVLRPSANAPREAQLVFELAMTVSKPDPNAPASDSGRRGGSRRGGSSYGRDEPSAPRVTSVVVGAWASLPLGTVSSAGSGSDPARSSRGGGSAEPTQYLRLTGGSIFRPKELPETSPAPVRGSSRGGRGSSSGGASENTLTVRIGSLSYEERDMAAMLPSAVVAPLDAINLLTSYRRLAASPPEGAPNLGRDATMSVVCTAAEQAAVSAGFAALSDSPDSLTMFAGLYATSLADAERRGGGGRSGGSSRFDPARSNNSSRNSNRGLDEPEQLRVLKEILLFAPLLGRQPRALPPYDATDSRHADERRQALEQLSNRCAADGALQLLCSDASAIGGAFAFAPLRAVDLNSI
jgi:hypothetical protein